MSTKDNTEILAGAKHAIEASYVAGRGTTKGYLTKMAKGYISRMRQTDHPWTTEQENSLLNFIDEFLNKQKFLYYDEQDAKVEMIRRHGCTGVYRAKPKPKKGIKESIMDQIASYGGTTAQNQIIKILERNCEPNIHRLALKEVVKTGKKQDLLQALTQITQAGSVYSIIH